MVGRRELTNFVRNTLGCACPDEVFERIEYEDGGDGEDRRPCLTIRIGGRLLIALWKIEDAAPLETGLPALLNAGKSERDRRGMNRFRLVIATDAPGTVGPPARAIFSNHAEKDDKIHLHVVSRQDAASLEGQSNNN